ncbi:hypothetical protein [Stenotrophomonas sp.]|uniref:hypothetical protein n=1 Tax=Stenotrophomonas sp. TaxID=69392 RepID=UPI00289E72EC|nr:hypothetical protein [Stenotrophomonas sp.]
MRALANRKSVLKAHALRGDVCPTQLNARAAYLAALDDALRDKGPLPARPDLRKSLLPSIRNPAGWQRGLITMAAKAARRPDSGLHAAAIERVKRECQALADIYWNGTLTQRAGVDESSEQQVERVQVCPTYLLLEAIEPIARCWALLTTLNRPTDVAACREDVLQFVLAHYPEHPHAQAPAPLQLQMLTESRYVGDRAFTALCQTWWDLKSWDDYSSFRHQVMHVIKQYNPECMPHDLHREARYVVEGLLYASPAHPDASNKRMLLRKYAHFLLRELDAAAAR